MITLDFDWYEWHGLWVCCFCYGDIDHLDNERDEDEGYAEDSYTCTQYGSRMCEHAYFMVRWSLSQYGDNGDALTLRRWVELDLKPNESAVQE